MEIVLPQIIFQAVNFLIVLGVLSYLLYKPITQIFEERAERIEKGQRAAQEAIEQQALLTQVGEKQRLELEKKTAQLLDQASKEAEEHKEKLMARAKLDAAEYLQKQRVKWDQERALLIAEHRQDLIRAVSMATEKLIKLKLSASEEEKLVNAQIEVALAELGTTK